MWGRGESKVNTRLKNSRRQSPPATGLVDWLGVLKDASRPLQRAPSVLKLLVGEPENLKNSSAKLKSEQNTLAVGGL